MVQIDTLPATDIGNALALAERVRPAIEAYRAEAEAARPEVLAMMTPRRLSNARGWVSFAFG